VPGPTGSKFPAAELMEKRDGQMRKPLDKIVVFIFAIILAGLLITPGPALCDAQEKPSLRTDIKRGLVILTRFPDVKPKINMDEIIRRFQRLDHYVGEMSYGKAAVIVDFTEWIELPLSISEYSISPANLKVDKSRVTRLIQDSINKASEKHDFSKYSFMVIFMGARFREYGMIGLCGYPGMLGWSQDIRFIAKDGQSLPGGVAIFTSQAHLGTLFHDCAHVWGGVKNGKRVVPCLYDHDIQQKHPTRDKGWENALINMGYWDPMSCHMISPGSPPPGISSWTKIRLGWLDTDKILEADPDESSEIVLGPLEDGSSDVLAVKIPLTDETYYLIENRQKIGSYDSQLPGEGVLIMYANDRIAECRHGRAPVKLMDADPKVLWLNGAAFSLPNKPKFVDNSNNIQIELIEKIGSSYKIKISRMK
jgi:hypothetical protein